MRMPDQKPGKEKDTDPCRSLLKALCIQKSTGKKNSRAPKTVAENGDAMGHPNARPLVKRNVGWWKYED
jgi:hypothetical protein